MGQGNYADYLRAIHDPAVQSAMIEDYRAGLGVDRAADDDADHTAGRQLACPTLVAWSTDEDLEELYGDVLAVWQPWAPDLQGLPIHSGHHMAEDAPDDLAAALADFLGRPQEPRVDRLYRHRCTGKALDPVGASPGG